MDAFFASIEQRENPSLLGRPVIVVGSGSPRSVVCAASYEARTYGVHSAMPSVQAARLCPQAAVVPANPRLYRDVSRSVFSICESFTDMLEISSIDECYMDMTGTAERFGGAMNAGRMIKDRVRREEGLTCTVGIGPGKLVAKLAAGMKKPDGLYQIRRGDIPALFRALPLSKLHGIGSKTAAKLKSMGITTAGSLGRVDRKVLVRVFGIMGETLADMGAGVDNSPVVPYYLRPRAKSVSHEHTLEKDTRDVEMLKRTLHYLSEQVAYRLRKQGLYAKNVGLTLRFRDLERVTRSRTINRATDDGLLIYRTAQELLDAALKDPRPIRLIGVAAGSLEEGVAQYGLFDDPRRKTLAEVVDGLNGRFGSMSVKPASLLDVEPGDHITFKG
jgi:DNA polymerase-4